MDDIIRLKEREYNISPLPDNPVIAMAYVPYQNAQKLYGVEQGISSGTMFPCLDNAEVPKNDRERKTYETNLII